MSPTRKSNHFDRVLARHVDRPLSIQLRIITNVFGRVKNSSMPDGKGK